MGEGPAGSLGAPGAIRGAKIDWLSFGLQHKDAKGDGGETMTDFVGTASALSQGGFSSATAMNGIDGPALWAVLSVETSGCGYLADKRPKILFERHIFSRLTNGQYDHDDPDISAPTAGGYGASGANQYLRLQAAVQLNRDAALKSASWGLGQIMGENYAAAGYSDVGGMVAAMVASEDAQLGAMASFIKANKMSSHLQTHDWAGFARLYNGPNYASNNYDGLLQHFCARYTSGSPPDLTVRAAQIYLTYRGFNVGAIDGLAGANTVAAVKPFQASIGAQATGTIDAGLLQKLSSAEKPGCRIAIWHPGCYSRAMQATKGFVRPGFRLHGVLDPALAAEEEMWRKYLLSITAWCRAAGKKLPGAIQSCVCSGSMPGWQLVVTLTLMWVGRMECDPLFTDRGLSGVCCASGQ